MKLTLRTLLAWLDDTLPPAEVRQIGHQVTETPIAQELVERIRLVTRQRRLMVPADSGPDGTDANRVAAYLDNTLSPQEVGDYEKKCLTSDVNLAEAASVHQILSLLGQKAKVPPDARERMYHLVRGREAAKPLTPRPAPQAETPPAVVPVWTPPVVPKRSLVERFGPLAAVAGLIAILCWSAWMSANPSPKVATPSLVARKDQAIPPPPPLPDPTKEVEGNTTIIAVQPEPTAAPAAADAKSDAETDVETAKMPTIAETRTPEAKAEAPPEIPRDAAAVLGTSEGVTLRYQNDTRAWDRLAAGASLRDGDRIVNLPPFYTPVTVGSLKVTLVGDAEIKILATDEGVSSLEFVRGRIRLENQADTPRARVVFDKTTIDLDLPRTTILGLQRIAGTRADASSPLIPQLGIIAAQGEATVTVGGTSESLAPNSALVVTVPDKIATMDATEIPAWVTETGPSVVAEMSGKGFADYFKPDKSALLALVEAAEDEDPLIRRMAVESLGSVGPLDLVVGTLSRKGDPDSRLAAIAVLRESLGRDEPTFKALHESLVQTGGSQEWAIKVEEMLAGYTPRDADDDETLAPRLVNLLKETEDVGVRELAIMSLQQISRRADRLGYDPDRPTEGNGLKAWQDLVQRREVRAPVAPQPKAATGTPKTKTPE